MTDTYSSVTREVDKRFEEKLKKYSQDRTNISDSEVERFAHLMKHFGNGVNLLYKEYKEELLGEDLEDGYEEIYIKYSDRHFDNFKILKGSNSEDEESFSFVYLTQDGKANYTRILKKDIRQITRFDVGEEIDYNGR